VEILQSVEQFEHYKKEERVVFMFSADWCGDCRFVEPVLPEIEQEFPEFTFIMVNRDKFIEICQENDVLGIPSFLAYKNGKEVGRFVSRDRKTKEEIVDFIKGLPA